MTHGRGRERWWPLVWLLLPLFVGFALRFWQLGRQALFFDEAFSADLALRPWRVALDLALDDVHPVLYYALLKVVVGALPLAEWSLRVLSAACSTLALALAMGITRRLAGWRVAAWAGWVLAWSSLNLYFAQEARMYALLELLWLLSGWLLLRALQPGTPARWRPWLAWAAATAVAVHTHFFGFLLWGVGAAASGAWLAARRERRALGRWLVAQALVAVAALPLSLLLLNTLRSGPTGTWIPGWRDVTNLWLLALFGFTPTRTHFVYSTLLSVPPWSALPWGAWAGLGGVLTAGSLAGWWRMRGTVAARQAAAPVAVFGLAPVILAGLFFSLARQPLWADRAFTGAVSWLLIGLAIGWSAFRRPIPCRDDSQRVSYSYPAAGQYPVTLTATNECGLGVSMRSVVVIDALPWGIYLPLSVRGQ